MALDPASTPPTPPTCPSLVPSDVQTLVKSFTGNSLETYATISTAFATACAFDLKYGSTC